MQKLEELYEELGLKPILQRPTQFPSKPKKALIKPKASPLKTRG